MLHGQQYNTIYSLNLTNNFFFDFQFWLTLEESTSSPSTLLVLSPTWSSNGATVSTFGVVVIAAEGNTNTSAVNRRTQSPFKEMTSDVLLMGSWFVFNL